MAKSPWGCCARCGFKRRLNTFRKEWTGERVCSDCFDKKPPDIKPPKIKPEGVPLPTAQPEPDPIYASYHDGSHL